MRLTGTQHAMSNPRTTVEGARDRCTMDVNARHAASVEGDATAWCTVGGRYAFGLIRGRAGWLIERVTLRALVIVGDGRVLAVSRG